ncbi:hypothetical protein GDO81_003664 [Engystomops pustulosus]|uniref:Uncharacterized protein n=1 Tax=Engystomops pustulosus TaxID=76066 RepID=A0AAV7A3M4_ENGPU|nr:hypothetical protein GDO81_003664 [Engystomops pustulosus]KAG8554106.1 hypothetical protein GDO81_003664 [Engystomops pustulosus]
MDSTKVCFYLFIIFSVASAAHRHVKAGTNTSICGLICYTPNGILRLQCIPKPSIFVAKCSNSIPEVQRGNKERFHLNGSSGCLLLKNVQKNDSCVYKIRFYGDNFTKITLTRIIILDAVKITKITSNFSEIDSNIALHVHFSGAEVTIEWEVDDAIKPLRYRLMDNNRTLIIQRLKEEDIKRKLVVRLKNPISEDLAEYHLEIQGKRPARTHLPATLALFIPTIVIVLLFYQQLKKNNLTKKLLFNGESEISLSNN